MKTNINCSVDPYLIQTARARGINVSLLLNNSLKALIEVNGEKGIEREIEEVKEEETKAESNLAIIKAKRLQLESIFNSDLHAQEAAELEETKMLHRSKILHGNREVY